MHRVVSYIFVLDKDHLSTRAPILHSVYGLILNFFPVLLFERPSSLPSRVLQLSLIFLVEVSTSLILRKIQILIFYIGHIAWFWSNWVCSLASCFVYFLLLIVAHVSALQKLPDHVCSGMSALRINHIHVFGWLAVINRLIKSALWRHR